MCFALITPSLVEFAKKEEKFALHDILFCFFGMLYGSVREVWIPICNFEKNAYLHSRKFENFFTICSALQGLNNAFVESN